MPPFSRSWEHSRSSCGSMISTNLPRGKRAWIPVGPALNIYETQLLPNIRDLLDMMAVENAPVITQLYMIGKTESNAKPVVMVCCTNREVGSEAKKNLKESDILDGFPAFTFGWTSLPLGLSSAVQPLAGNEQSLENHDDDVDLDSWEIDKRSVFSTSNSPGIGRRLYKSEGEGSLVKWAIGGVILQRNDSFFQLTVEHTQRDAAIDDERHPQSILGHELDSDFDIDDADSEGFDYDVLSHASFTPGPSINAPTLDSQERHRSISWRESQFDIQREGRLSLEKRRTSEVQSMATNGANSHIAGDSCRKNLVKVGTISLRASDGDRPGLDYSMIAIETPASSDLINELTVPHGLSQSRLVIREAATSFIDERRVFLVVVGGKLIPGTIAPGTILFKRKSEKRSEDMHLVQLDGALSLGDCGAAVVDQISGVLYGHLVRGCPGTGIGYIIPAANVLHDLASRNLDIRFAAYNSGGQVLDVSTPDQARSGSVASFQDFDSRLSVAKHTVLTPTSLSSLERPRPEVDFKQLSHYLDRAYFFWPYQMFISQEEKRDLSSWEDTFRFPIELLRNGEWLFQGEEKDSLQISELEKFCTGTTIHQLRQSPFQKRLIWLDERDSKNGLKRPISRWLTAGQLYHALNEKRFSGQINADRRLIYVHDFDSWTALALIATLSEHSSATMMGAMYKHLRFSAYFGAALSRNRHDFSMSFHLPYFVCSTNDHVQCEMDSFRKKYDLSFLTSSGYECPGEDSMSFLYQTHVAFVIFGYDQWRWTGMLLLDSFNDSDDQKQHFRDDVEADEGFFDPLTHGAYDASRPIWQPSAYFIRVLQARIKRVSMDFDRVALKLESAINLKVSEIDSPKKPALPNPIWGRRFNGLANQLIHTISRVLESWDRLESHEIVFLLGSSRISGHVEDDIIVIHDIRRSMEDLRDTRRILLGLQDLCISEVQRQSTTIHDVAAQTKTMLSILNITRLFVPIIASAALLSAGIYFGNKYLTLIMLFLIFVILISIVDKIRLWYDAHARKAAKRQRSLASKGTDQTSDLGSEAQPSQGRAVTGTKWGFSSHVLRRRQEKPHDVEKGLPHDVYLR